MGRAEWQWAVEETSVCSKEASRDKWRKPT